MGAQGDDTPGNGESIAALSPWSAWQSLTVNVPPRAPKNLYPVADTGTNETNPTFSAAYEDRDPQDAGSLRFHVYDSNGSQLAASPSSTDVLPGAVVEWTLPDLDAAIPGQQGLAAAPYTWKVEACDGVNPCVPSARLTFTVDNQLTAPVITAAPALASPESYVTWSFSGGTGESYECELRLEDEVLEAFSPCTSPKTFDLLTAPKGAFEFAVRRIDALGNPSPAAHGSYVYLSCADCTETTLVAAVDSSSTDTSPVPIDFAVADVQGFDPLGGQAVVEPDTPNREVIYYEGVDPTTNRLLAVYRPTPIPHPAAAVVRVVTLATDPEQATAELAARGLTFEEEDSNLDALAEYQTLALPPQDQVQTFKNFDHKDGNGGVDTRFDPTGSHDFPGYEPYLRKSTQDGIQFSRIYAAARPKKYKGDSGMAKKVFLGSNEEQVLGMAFKLSGVMKIRRFSPTAQSFKGEVKIIVYKGNDRLYECWGSRKDEGRFDEDPFQTVSLGKSGPPSSPNAHINNGACEIDKEDGKVPTKIHIHYRSSKLIVSDKDGKLHYYGAGVTRLRSLTLHRLT